MHQRHNRGLALLDLADLRAVSLDGDVGKLLIRLINLDEVLIMVLWRTRDLNANDSQRRLLDA